MLVALGLPPWFLQIVHEIVYGRLAGTLVYLALIGVWVFIGIRLELWSRR
jgi:hypothetical protein